MHKSVGCVVLFFAVVCAQPASANYASGRKAFDDHDYERAAREWRQSAQAGDVASQRALGDLYRDGLGVLRDPHEAALWYFKAARRGDAQAQLAMGLARLNGQGVERDATYAVGWFRKAAALGNTAAQVQLARAYGDGIGAPRDERLSAQWARKAAERHDANGEALLALCYRIGAGVPKDDKQALGWYRRAADKGLAEAQFKVGQVYSIGWGVPQDAKTAVQWFSKAAEQGNVDAQFELGRAYSSGDGVEKNLATAARWYGKAADSGDARAQYQLGRAYVSGAGIEKDTAKAFALFKAAAQDDAHPSMSAESVDRAQCALAEMYRSGFAGPADADQARYWLIKLFAGPDEKVAAECVDKDLANWIEHDAQAGNAKAQTLAGDLYEHGFGVRQDPEKAFAWYLKAARQNDDLAQWNVAVAYMSGAGVEKDSAAAAQWFERALSLGFTDAGTLLAQAYRDGDGVTKDEAKALAINRQIGDDYEIGLAYLHGKGIERDPKIAVDYLRKAVLAGAPFAGCTLGNVYLDGAEGVPKDNAEAYRWMILQKGYSERCVKRLAELTKHMTAAEHARAEADPGVVAAANKFRPWTATSRPKG